MIIEAKKIGAVVERVQGLLIFLSAAHF
jgi:hypothetical protein